jgi:transcription elongation factor Spt5
MAFFAVKTAANNERRVADAVDEMWEPPVHAVLCPQALTGYVIIEADTVDDAEQVISDVSAAKSVLPGETSWNEVEGFLSPKSSLEGLEEGDIVRVLKGSFEGDTAEVTRLNHSDEKATVELVDSVVPIPVELPGDQLRKIEKH